MLSFRNIIIAGVAAVALMAVTPLPARADATNASPAASEQPAADTADKADAAGDADPADKAGAADPADKAGAADKGDKADKADAGAEKEANSIAAAIVHGPNKVQLGDQAVVDMPKDFAFLPKEQALAVMEQMGNKMDEENFYGLFLPVDENQKWFIAASFDDSGYIKDDDQSKIDPDAILSDMKKGVEEDNTDRKEKGIATIEVVGWIEKPHYDSSAHQLIWSVEAKEAGPGAAPDSSVNYNTFALGRGGFISLNLVTARATVDTDRKAVATLLGNLHFDDGKKYENFDPKTDKVAEYGLMALIGGIAAHKIGLFAVAAGLLLKFKAVLVAAAAAGAGAFRKFFKRRDPTV